WHATCLWERRVKTASPGPLLSLPPGRTLTVLWTPACTQSSLPFARNRHAPTFEWAVNGSLADGVNRGGDRGETADGHTTRPGPDRHDPPAVAVGPGRE